MALKSNGGNWIIIKAVLAAAKIAQIVLTLSHSNAEAEWLFSIARKHETESCSCLMLNGQLYDILAMKSHYTESRIPCLKWVPEEDIMKAATTATVRNFRCYCRILLLEIDDLP